MKIPQHPPDHEELFDRLLSTERLKAVFGLVRRIRQDGKYLHWDQLQHRSPRRHFSHEEWWLALKLKRRASYRQLPLLDKIGKPFVYFIPDKIQEVLHEIDFGGGGFIGMPASIVNPQTRDHYIFNSLIQEAITSSQLEGAITARKVAKEMLRTGRKPRDISEHMILNNFQTMQYIIEIKDKAMTPELLLDIHRRITEDTLDNPEAAGRYRRTDEPIRVADPQGAIYHDPPPADELGARVKRMCDFANEKTPGRFIPPVIRAIILHFWLAYDHPFVDGNGRTARALFYWYMLRHGFWLLEFVSISSILVKAPAQYIRSFLYTETDDNDLNYFIIYQSNVLHRAIRELHDYLDRKQREVRLIEDRLQYLRQLNHRQQSLLLYALRHPYEEYTIKSHQRSHRIAYGTARSDLLELSNFGLLSKGLRGKAMIFRTISGLDERLKRLSNVN